MLSPSVEIVPMIPWQIKYCGRHDLRFCPGMSGMLGSVGRPTFLQDLPWICTIPVRCVVNRVGGANPWSLWIFFLSKKFKLMGTTAKTSINNEGSVDSMNSYMYVMKANVLSKKSGWIWLKVGKPCLSYWFSSSLHYAVHAYTAHTIYFVTAQCTIIYLH